MSRSFKKRLLLWSRRASASKMWERRCAIMRAASRLHPSASRKRLEAGKKLEKLVEAEINDLAMRASFRIAVDENDGEEHWTSSGINQVIYRISTNAGETMRPLEQIASGGELSRVMLALKACVETGKKSVARAPSSASKAAQRTLVF